LSEVIIS